MPSVPFNRTNIMHKLTFVWRRLTISCITFKTIAFSIIHCSHLQVWNCSDNLAIFFIFINKCLCAYGDVHNDLRVNLCVFPYKTQLVSCVKQDMCVCLVWSFIVFVFNFIFRFCYFCPDWTLVPFRCFWRIPYLCRRPVRQLYRWCFMYRSCWLFCLGPLIFLLPIFF